MILIVRQKPTPEAVGTMLEAHSTVHYIKLAVDVETGLVAGGGDMHADCEEMLLEEGCKQHNIWGAGWYVDTQTVAYDSLINIRPKLGNRTIELEDIHLRNRIKTIVETLFVGVNP
jgi:hypothetical protein